MSTSEIAPQTATLVPQERRQEFLPALFGLSLLLIADNAVYIMMDRLSPLDYGGGFWDFYEHEGKPLFLAPKSRSRFRITGEIARFQGEVSAEAAGIIATMFAFPVSRSNTRRTLSQRATSVFTPIRPSIRKLPRYSRQLIEKLARHSRVARLQRYRPCRGVG